MWALFSAPFNHDRRPQKAMCFRVEPGLRNLPRDVVRAAIEAGKAIEVPRPNKAMLKDTRHGDRGY